MKIPKYNDISLEKLEQIAEDLIVTKEEKDRKGYSVLTNKKGALLYLKEQYKSYFTKKEAETNLKIAEEELWECSYVITETGIAPYGLKLDRNESKTKEKT